MGLEQCHEVSRYTGGRGISKCREIPETVEEDTGCVTTFPETLKWCRHMCHEVSRNPDQKTIERSDKERRHVVFKERGLKKPVLGECER